jgi:hypothetical protein
MKQLPCPRALLVDPTTQSPGDIILCNIQNAEVTVNALTEVLQKVIDPSVFVMDATCFAGMLVAERWNIPTVLMVEQAEVFLRYVLGAPKVPTTSSGDGGGGLFITIMSQLQYFNPRFWYQTITSAMQDRLNSLDLTSSFIALNRVRARYKMGRLRLLTNIWRVGGGVLLINSQTTHNPNQDNLNSNNMKGRQKRTSSDADTDVANTDIADESGWRHILPNSYTIPDPLLPPCIACINAPVTTRRDKKAIFTSKTKKHERQKVKEWC